MINISEIIVRQAGYQRSFVDARGVMQTKIADIVTVRSHEGTLYQLAPFMVIDNRPAPRGNIVLPGPSGQSAFDIYVDAFDLAHRLRASAQIDVAFWDEVDEAMLIAA